MSDWKEQRDKAYKKAERKKKRSKVYAVSYTHLTLPTICSV